MPLPNPDLYKKIGEVIDNGLDHKKEYGMDLEKIKNVKNNVYSISAGRTALISATIGLMIKDLYGKGEFKDVPIEAFFDKDDPRLAKQRIEYGQKIQAAYLNGANDPDSLGQMLSDGFEYAMEYALNYVMSADKEAKYADFAPQKLLGEKAPQIWLAYHAAFDSSQEIKHLRTYGEKTGKPFPNIKKLQSLADRASAVGQVFGIDYEYTLKTVRRLVSEDGRKNIQNAAFLIVQSELFAQGPAAFLKAKSAGNPAGSIDNWDFIRRSDSEKNRVSSVITLGKDNPEYIKVVTEIISNDKTCETFVNMLMDGSFASEFFTEDKIFGDGFFNVVSPLELRNKLERFAGVTLPSHAEELRAKFAEFRKTINSIGQTAGDSREYKEFLSTFERAEAVINSQNPADGAINVAIEALKQAAYPYYNSKLLISQSSTQARRFALTDEIMSLGDRNISEEERLLTSIARKAILGQAAAYASSRDANEKAFAEKYAPGSTALDEYAKKLAASHEFRLRAGSDIAALKAFFKNTPADLAKSVFPVLPGSRRAAFEETKEKMPLPENAELFPKLRSLLAPGVIAPEKYGIASLTSKGDVYGVPGSGDALSVLAIGMLLEDYDISDILDPTQLEKERLDIGRTVSEKYRSGGFAYFGKSAVTAYLRVIEKTSEYLKSKLRGDITTNFFLREDMKDVLTVSRILNEAVIRFETMAEKDPSILTADEYISRSDYRNMVHSAKAITSRLGQYQHLFEKACDLYEDKIPAGTEKDNAEKVGEMFADAAGIVCSRTRQIMAPSQSMSDARDFSAKVGDVREKTKVLIAARLGSGAAANNVKRILSDRASRRELARNLLDPDVQKSLIVIDDSVCDYTVENPRHSVLLGDTAPLLDNCMSKAMGMNAFSDEEFFEQIRQACERSEMLKPSHYGFDSGTLVNNLGLSVSRDAGTSLVIGALLSKNYSIDSIFNGEVSEAVMQETGREVGAFFAKAAETEEEKAKLGEFAVKSFVEVMKQGLSYLNDKMPSPLSTEDLLKPENRNLLSVIHVMMDAGQEYEHVKNYVPEELKSDYESLRDRRNAVCTMVTSHEKVLKSVNAIYTGKDEFGNEMTVDSIESEFVGSLLSAAAGAAYSRHREFLNPSSRFDMSEAIKAGGTIKNSAINQLNAMDPDEDISRLVRNGGGDLHKFLRSVVRSEVMDNFFDVSDDGVRITKEGILSIPELPPSGKYPSERVKARKSIEDSLLNIWKLNDSEIIRERENETDPAKKEEMIRQNPTVAEMEKEPDPIKKAGMRNILLSSAMKYFTIESGNEALYTGDAEKTVDTMAERLEQGREVFFIQPGTKARREEYFRFKLSDTGEVSYSKAAGRMIKTQEERIQTLKQLNTMKAALESTGVTRGDSDAFKNMKKAVNDAIEGVTNGSRVLTDTVFGDIRRSAEQYYFEKLDQPHNSRRSTRFEIADQLRNYGVKQRHDNRKLAEMDRLSYSIAAKVVKTKATEFLRSGNVELRTRGYRLLEGGKTFRSFVNKLMETDSFDKLVRDKSAKQLREEFSKDPKDLKAAVLGKPPKESKIIEQPEMAGPALQ